MSNRIRLTLVAIVSTIAVALGLAVAAAPFGAVPAIGAAGMHSATAHTGTLAAGARINVKALSHPVRPTKAQLARSHRLLKLPAGPIGPHPLAASLAGPQGPQTATSAQLPGDLTFFKKTTPPAVCPTDCAQSTINEPSTVGAGKVLYQTSNWNIAFTQNGGAAAPTWQYIDPYLLNPGFCCDQTAVYVPSRNVIIREGLIFGTGAAQGIDLDVSSPATPGSVCQYHLSAGLFGGTDGNLMDYPKLAFSNSNLYLTYNQYTPNGSAWINTNLVRFNLDQLKACGGVGFSFLNRNDNFTYGLSYGEGSADTFYWVSNWYTQGAGSGTSERIFHWADNSNTYFFNDVGVAAYNFSGGNCASQDGVVTNWCTRLDPRWETASIGKPDWAANTNGAYGGDDLLTVAITAGPAGADPFPYVIYEYFHLHAPSYITTGATFNDGFAFAYGGCSPNDQGDIGCSATYGGGTGSSHFFPAGITILQDDVTPTQPWGFSFNQTGAGNASGWGDYEYTQPYNPSFGAWITTEWYVNSSNVVRPQVLVFGRGRDAGGYGKWKNS